MRMSRLFEIVYTLLEKKRVTANELAARFEVSKRTILRDIETLTIAGIPLYTSKGRGGGISLLDNFVLDKTTLTEEDQNQILMALQSLAPIEHIDAGDVLSKLGALFKNTDTTWIEVDFSRWGNREPDKEKFEILKNAILQRFSVSFTYPNSCGEISNRTVYPLKLVFKSKAWYVQAYCLQKKDYRTFKINRMLQIKVLPNSFAGQNFAPPPIEADAPSSTVCVHLELAFSAEVAYRVYDEFDAKNVQRNRDSSFTVTVDLPEDYWLYGFLLSFGTSVRVIEPQSVRNHLLDQVETIKNFYSENIR